MDVNAKKRFLRNSAEDLDEAAGFFRYVMEEDNVDWEGLPEKIINELEDLAQRAINLVSSASDFRLDK